MPEEPKRHDLLFYKRRSTPWILHKGVEPPAERPHYGEFSSRRPANDDEEAEIAKGKWLRVDEAGNRPGSNEYKKTELRPKLLRKKTMKQATLLKSALDWADLKNRLHDRVSEFKDSAREQGPDLFRDAKKMVNNVRKPIADFMRGDNEGMDWRWGMIGSTGMDMAQKGINKATNGMLGKQMMFDPSKTNHLNANNWLRDFAKQKGIRISDDVTRLDKGVDSVLENMRRAGAYISGNEINLPATQNSPGVLAHELGHSSQSFKMRMVRKLGGGVNMLGTGGALFTHDKNDAFSNALIGTAGGAGVLANEIDASMKGSKLLAQAGMKGKGRAGAFLGLPTYAAAMGMPLAAYKVKDLMGGFDGQKSGSLKKKYPHVTSMIAGITVR